MHPALTVTLALIGAFALFFLCHWLLCRLAADRCPRCGSKWRTELQGEWAGEEDWKCHRCGHVWGKRV